ncbi:MAG: hypothetical protein M1538_00100 [Candidatus Marsarchaeota archaeon]|jgi:Zn-dependent oligopeptidase|nr:hypothetical protein [Candidatus Marsarchaeota archaeon]
MLDGLKSNTIGKLIATLHNSLLALTKTTEALTQKNKEVNDEEIRALRSNIQKKLDSNEEINDNKELIKLLDLFTTNKEVIKYIKEEADEWLKLLKTIEQNLINKEEGLTVDEKKEITKIITLTKDIKEIIRNNEE